MSQLNLFDDATSAPMTWAGDRRQALAQLQAFAPRAGRAYAAKRNHDLGPGSRSNISCLSPWIRHRLLLEEEVLREILSRHAFSDAEKFIQEVFWRTYFKGWLEHRPSVWTQYRADVAALVQQLDRASDVSERYTAAISGATGIDCFDAWVTELKELGYLHNHARMWFASIWIFTLRLPWQLGADLFYRHLLDGDPASNTLSWRWAAGLHTKGKTYLARPGNIEKYTGGRFSPTGLSPAAPALTDAIDHPVQGISPISNCNGSQPFGLLLTEEDLHLDSLPLRGKPIAICAVSAAQARSPLAVGARVYDFTNQALEDAQRRAQSHFGCPIQQSDAADWGAVLTQWAQQIGVETVVTPWAPVGPVREKLERARPLLEDAGINLVQIMRPYDAMCWPHATKGFFALKTKIPSLLQQLGLS